MTRKNRDKDSKRLVQSHGLYKKGFPRSRQWAVDVDYINKLGPKDKAWLSRFLREFHAADIYRSDPKSLHKDHLRRLAYVEGNAARRDLYGNADVVGAVKRVGTEQWRLEQVSENPSEYEDSFLDALDAKRALDKQHQSKPGDDDDDTK